MKNSSWFSAFLLIGFAWLPQLSWGGKIVVVLSRTLQPYEQAYQGIASQINNNVAKMDMQGNMEKGKSIMQSISSVNTDLVVTIGSEATLSAKKYLGTIPVVYTMVLEETGFPGRLSGGVLMQVKLEQQFDTISKLLPNIKDVGVLYNIHYSAAVINDARQIIKKSNMNLVPIGVEADSDVAGALGKLTRDKVGILWCIVDPTIAKPEIIQKLIQHSLKEKIPFIALSQYHVKAGALAAISVDYTDMGIQTAVLAQKLLQSQSNYGVEAPRKLILFLNNSTQEKLGITTVPPIPGVTVVKE